MSLSSSPSLNKPNSIHLHHYYGIQIICIQLIYNILWFLPFEQYQLADHSWHLQSWNLHICWKFLDSQCRRMGPMMKLATYGRLDTKVVGPLGSQGLDAGGSEVKNWDTTEFQMVYSMLTASNLMDKVSRNNGPGCCQRGRFLAQKCQRRWHWSEVLLIISGHRSSLYSKWPKVIYSPGLASWGPSWLSKIR